MTLEREHLLKLLRSGDIPIWLPSLTWHLAKFKWDVLAAQKQLDLSNYSTSRFLFGKDCSASFIASTIGYQQAGRNLLPIELLTKNAEQAILTKSLQVASLEEIERGNVLATLSDAIDVLRNSPTLLDTISALARSVVVLKSENDFCDVSYSSPEIPFSIFISIPPPTSPNSGLRVAEAIVHECMHLQLTLLDEIEPLFMGQSEFHYSPWKGEVRSSSGILHALYVFAAIYSWLARVKVKTEGFDYVLGRLRQISCETLPLSQFRDSADLSAVGKALCQRIFEEVNSEGVGISEESLGPSR